MRKEDIINQIQKVVYDDYTIHFIIQTQGDNDFWYWSVNRYDVKEYFKKSSSALFELANNKLSKRHCNIFINDCNNDLLGVSCASFETIEDVLKDLGVI